jgi:hypothetical protein
VGGLHQRMQGVDEFFGFAILCEEFRDANHLGGVLTWHLGFFL